jgi:hypothetical protein
MSSCCCTKSLCLQPLFLCNLLTLGCLRTPCDWLMSRHMTTHQTATYAGQAHRTVLSQNGFQSACPNQPATHVDSQSRPGNVSESSCCKPALWTLSSHSLTPKDNWKIMTIKFMMQIINSPLQKLVKVLIVLHTKIQPKLLILRRNNLQRSSRRHVCDIVRCTQAVFRLGLGTCTWGEVWQEAAV